MTNIVRINTFDIVQALGMKKNIWYDYDQENAKVFLEAVLDIIDESPNADTAHISGLFPPEVALPLGAIVGRTGMKILYSRPTSPRIELHIPERCPELGFV